MRRRLQAVKLLAATGLALVGYAIEGSAQPILATGPDAEVTGDGLHLVDPSIMSAAWVRPDLAGVPPNTSGSEFYTIRWLWEANIVLELRDSMSHDVLARTAYRERVDGPFRFGEATVAITASVVEDWSQLLVERLEELTNLSQE